MTSPKQNRQNAKSTVQLQNYIKNSYAYQNSREGRNLGVKNILRQLSQDSLAASQSLQKRDSLPQLSQVDNGQNPYSESPKNVLIKAPSSSFLTQVQQFIPFVHERDHLGRKIRNNSGDKFNSESQTSRDNVKMREQEQMKRGIQSARDVSPFSGANINNNSYFHLKLGIIVPNEDTNNNSQNEITLNGSNSCRQQHSPRKNRIIDMIETYKKKNDVSYLGNKKTTLYEVEDKQLNHMSINYQLNIKYNQPPELQNNNNVAKKRFIVYDELEKRRVASDRNVKQFIEKALLNKIIKAERKNSKDNLEQHQLDGSQDELTKAIYKLKAQRSKQFLHSKSSKDNVTANSSLLTAANDYSINVLKIKTENNERLSSQKEISLPSHRRISTEFTEVPQSLPSEFDELDKKNKKSVKFTLSKNQVLLHKKPTQEYHLDKPLKVKEEDLKIYQAVGSSSDQQFPRIEHVSYPNTASKGVNYLRAFEQMRQQEEKRFHIEGDKIPVNFDGSKEQREFLARIQVAKQRIRRMHTNLNLKTQEVLKFYENHKDNKNSTENKDKKKHDFF